MNVYIFSYPINNFKILLKSSHNIESVLLFFNFSVTQVTSLPYSSIRSRPLSGHASKGRFKTRKSRDGANTTLTTIFLPKKKNNLCSEQLKQPFYSLIHNKNDRGMLSAHNADNCFLNLSWNILHTIYILQLQQPVLRLKMEILMSQCTNERTQTTINTTLTTTFWILSKNIHAYDL